MKLRKLIIGAVLSALCLTGITACQANDTSADSAAQSSENSNTAAEDSVNPTGGNLGEVSIGSGDTVAEIEIEGYGTITAKLFPDIAPIGVENFKELADQGYYDGKNIHRVISDFMMQGGSENGDGTGGSAAYSGEGSTDADFGTEISRNARHFYGALCYANALGRNSTQFYIVNSKKEQTITGMDTSDFEDTAKAAKEYKEQCTEGTNEYNYYAAYEKQYSAMAEWFSSPTQQEIDKYKEGGVYYLDGGYTVFGQVVDGFDVIDSIASVEVTENSSGEASKPVEDIIIKTVRVYTAD